jgi:molybdate transport system substrate-binding protein
VRRMILWFLLVGTVLGAGALSAAEHDRPFIVFAAASLTEAVTEVSAAFTQETGIAVKTSFAASSVLARQIEAGAPATVFFAADEEWMDYLEKRKLLAPGSRNDVLGNQLVLVAPADSTVTVKITSGPALVQGLGGARIATGDPDSVPVGKYAKAALIKLGVWEQVEGRLVRAEDVRSALAFIARGDAPFGIVYLTDAKIEKRVKLLDVFPQDTYPPIRYPIAMTAGAGADASRFVEFVTGKRAAGIFQSYGFELIAKSGQTARAADTDPCSRFIWDVSRELAVMKQAPRAVAAAVKPGADVPRIEPETLYEVKLADQSAVTFVAKPGKPTLNDGAHAGFVQFRVEKAGRYRVSITSGHWIEIVDGRQLVSSRDFQGQRSCQRPQTRTGAELERVRRDLAR